MSVFTCVNVEPCTDSLTEACGPLYFKYDKLVFFTGLLTPKMYRLPIYGSTLSLKLKCGSRSTNILQCACGIPVKLCKPKCLMDMIVTQGSHIANKMEPKW